MKALKLAIACGLIAASVVACGRSSEELLAEGNAALNEALKDEPDTAVVNDGVRALREFTTKNLGHQHADSAYYLLGVIYGATQRNADAAEAFMALVETHTTSRLRPKSLILASQAFENVMKYGHAKQCMQTLMAEYPNHDFVKGGSAKWLFLNIGKDPEEWDQSFAPDSAKAAPSGAVR